MGLGPQQPQLERRDSQGDFVLPLSPATTVHAHGPVFLVADASSGRGLEHALFASRGSSGRLRSLAARAPPPPRRPSARTLLAAALVLAVLASLAIPPLRAGLHEALVRARAGAPPPRAHDLDCPVLACCIGEQCVRNSRGRHAVVTRAHDERAVSQLQQLESSVRQSNPGVDVGVMVVRGSLGAAATRRLLGLSVTVIYVDPPSAEQRASSHDSSASMPDWMALRAFGLTQYDAILLVDSGAHIAADLSPLFALPTDFAAGWEQARLLGSGASAAAAARAASSAGGLFLRPCAATEANMLDILRRQRTAGSAQPAPWAALPASGDTTAEHAFAAWYFQSNAALPFDVFVLNLDGEVGNARLAAFQRTFEASDLRSKNFVRFPAVNGSTLDITRLVSPRALDDIESAERQGFRTRHYQMTRGSVGCYMSHLHLFQTALRSEAEFTLIFEDDVLIAPHLLASLVEAKPFPDDWDIMLVGHICNDCPLMPEAPVFRRVLSFFGTHAYVVHRRGLQKIFAYPRLMPAEKQIDAMMGDMSRAGLLNIYAVASPLAWQNKRKFSTTIQVPVKRSWGVDPYSQPEDEEEEGVQAEQER